MRTPATILGLALVACAPTEPPVCNGVAFASVRVSVLEPDGVTPANGALVWARNSLVSDSSAVDPNLIDYPDVLLLDEVPGWITVAARRTPLAAKKSVFVHHGRCNVVTEHVTLILQ